MKLLGPRSETLSDLQLQLLADEEPGTTLDEVEAEARRSSLTAVPPRQRRPHPGRQRLPENLPRVEEVVPCAEQTCKQCGAATAVMGYDESEQLDVQPARYFVRVIKREKRACRCCETGAVAMPPLAPQIVEKGLASDRVVIETVVAKYSDHLPPYRQAVILEREAGLEIGRATLDGWVMRVGELLEPVVSAMRQDLLRASYLQADETIVPVQMHDKRGADHQAYLWQSASREERRYSISAWGEAARVHKSSWASGKASYRLTGIKPTTTSAGRSWCMWAAGRMPGVNSLTP